MFGSLVRDGHHIQVADALNSDTFEAFLEKLQTIYPPPPQKRAMCGAY